MEAGQLVDNKRVKISLFMAIHEILNTESSTLQKNELPQNRNWVTDESPHQPEPWGRFGIDS
jgi:hypothetical protein